MSMRVFNPLSMFADIARQRALVAALARRDVLGRYRGSFAGLLWSFFNPLLMLAVYTFVFSVVLKARWGVSGDDSKSTFSLTLFSGLIAFGLFSECVTRSPMLITSNVNYVKKVVFPLEILPVVSLLSAAFHASVGILVWMIFSLMAGRALPVTLLALPLAYLPLAMLVLGLSWLFASLGVFMRDVVQVVGVAVMALMFMTPIFYPVQALPEAYRGIMLINPLTQIVEIIRDLMMSGRLPDPVAWIRITLISYAIAWLGYVWFQKTKKGFADVL